MTTPFAQLGYQQKQATSLGWTAADIGVGSIPVVGSVWNLGRGIYHATQGHWGDAAAGLLGAGLGLVGAGGAAAAAKGGLAAANAARGVQAATRLGRFAQAARAVPTNMIGRIASVGANSTGVAGQAARGLMNAGTAVQKFEQATPTLMRLGGKNLTVGRAVTGGAPIAAAVAAPSSTPSAPAAPAPNPNMPAWIPAGSPYYDAMRSAATQ